MNDVSPFSPEYLRSLPDMPISVETLAGMQKMEADAFKATVMLWMWAWRSTPRGTLPAADELLASAGGIRRRDVWAKLKDQGVLNGFELGTDGRVHHAVLEAKAVHMQVEAEKERKRKATDAKRQRDLYQRRKLAKKNGNATPLAAKPTPRHHVLKTPVQPRPHPLPPPPHAKPSSPHRQSQPNQDMLRNITPRSSGPPPTGTLSPHVRSRTPRPRPDQTSHPASCPVSPVTCGVPKSCRPSIGIAPSETIT